MLDIRSSNDNHCYRIHDRHHNLDDIPCLYMNPDRDLEGGLKGFEFYWEVEPMGLIEKVKAVWSIIREGFYAQHIVDIDNSQARKLMESLRHELQRVDGAVSVPMCYGRLYDSEKGPCRACVDNEECSYAWEWLNQ